MKSYWYHLRLLSYRLLLVLFLFSLSRLFFYILNFNHFSDISGIHLFTIFTAGIRFDICTLFYVNALFIVLHCFPGNFKDGIKWQFTLKILFVLINALALIPDFIDAKFFAFEEKRLTADIFSSVWLGEDFKALLPVFIHDYWYIVLTWIIFVCALWFLYPKFHKKKYDEKITTGLKLWLFQSLAFIACIGVFILGLRGSTGLKPIRMITAANYTDAKNIPLVLNSAFTLLKTLGNNDLNYVEYYSDEDSLKQHFLKTKQYKHQESFRPLNVMIIILESFGKEYIGSLNGNQGYTPFLDSLIKKSLVFENAFANGKKSIEAVPSIFASLPALMNNPYITSSYSSSNLSTLPKILKQQGYHSVFFHGGKNGTMGFDTFSRLAGFDDYRGASQYPDKKDNDGNWGIFDEPYFQYVAHSLDTLRKPFLVGLFTLSSHHPYTIPPQWKGRFRKGPLVNLESIGYADYSLRKFFERASQASWFNQTLFVLTADHTAQAFSTFYNNKVGMYAIPIIYYAPGDSSLIGKEIKITQQIDIMPSILDYLNYNKPLVAFGNSVFDNPAQSWTVSYLNGVYQMIRGDFALSFDGNQSTGLYMYNRDIKLSNNLLKTEKDTAASMEAQLKAIIQSYNQSLLKNDFKP